jgi:hypothetical protein
MAPPTPPTASRESASRGHPPHGQDRERDDRKVVLPANEDAHANAPATARVTAAATTTGAASQRIKATARRSSGVMLCLAGVPRESRRPVREPKPGPLRSRQAAQRRGIERNALAESRRISCIALSTSCDSRSSPLHFPRHRQPTPRARRRHGFIARRLTTEIHLVRSTPTAHASPSDNPQQPNGDSTWTTGARHHATPNARQPEDTPTTSATRLSALEITTRQ